ncbi:MAG: S24 family peptidase [Bryobacteraceae bacterium]
MICLVAYTDPRIGQINEALQRHGKSMRWLTRELISRGAKASHATVTNVLNGNTKNPHNPKLVDLMVQVLQEQTDNFDKIPLVHRSFVRIPVYPGISAGVPGYDVTDVDYEEVPDWGGERDRWGRVVIGDSMLPVFRPGDVVIIEDRPPVAGLVVQAYNNGDDVLKCWREVSGRQELWSFNDEYLPMPADGWAVRGVAVGRIRYSQGKVRLFLDAPGGISWSQRESDF